MKGSPGGILLIAIGVVLLQIAATGRFKAVWSALSTGTSSTPTETETGGTPESPNNDVEGEPGEPPTSYPAEVTVMIVATGTIVYASGEDLQATVADGGGTACKVGSTLVKTVASGKHYCVPKNKLRSEPSTNSGGDVPEIIMQTPTGRTVAYKNRSNTRGLMDVPVNVA